MKKQPLIWANLLHFYQPAEQSPRMLGEVTRESYQKIIDIIAHTGARATLNIAPTLALLWRKHGYTHLLRQIASLLEKSQIELTGTAHYHAFLPLLPEKEISRQIKLAEKTLRRIFGHAYQPHGFFAPECGYVPRVARLVAEAGFSWLILDELAYDGTFGHLKCDHLYEHADQPGLTLFFAERVAGYLGIMRGLFLHKKVWADFYHQRLSQPNANYLVIVTDAEIYGYHRPGQEGLLASIYEDKNIQSGRISDLLNLLAGSAVEFVQPLSSSWSSLPQELKQGIPYPFWQHPDSRVHRDLSKLQALVIRGVEQAYAKRPHSNQRAREALDRALASDAFWWGSEYKSWWSPGLIEYGAYLLLKALHKVRPRKGKAVQKARQIYEKLILYVWEQEYQGRVEEWVKRDLARMHRFEAYLHRYL